ncbi:hypothetical protein OXX79_012357 [Metschnikowia pulcherrima]
MSPVSVIRGIQSTFFASDSFSSDTMRSASSTGVNLIPACSGGSKMLEKEPSASESPTEPPRYEIVSANDAWWASKSTFTSKFSSSADFSRVFASASPSDRANDTTEFLRGVLAARSRASPKFFWSNDVNSGIKTFAAVLAAVSSSSSLFDCNRCKTGCT